MVTWQMPLRRHHLYEITTMKQGLEQEGGAGATSNISLEKAQKVRVTLPYSVKSAALLVKPDIMRPNSA